MPAEFPELARGSQSHNLRLETMVKTRWLAVLGQTIAVLVVWLLLEFKFDPTLCFVLIIISALLNGYLSIRFPPNTRLSQRSSTLLLAYDLVQLSILLFLTGGLGNPFSLLLLVPVVISATTLSIPSTAFLGVVAISLASLLAFFYFPLPWGTRSGLVFPPVYIAGMWFAIISSLLFTSVYAFRVADEARKLSDALSATELVLQREQHLSSLDGLAAAAAHELGTPLATISLVSKEMLREVDEASPLYGDITLLRSQTERCREIMKTLTSLSTEGDVLIGIVPFSVILEEVCQPHRNFGIDIEILYPSKGQAPLCRRNPGILYGLGNLVENAVDHAAKKVQLIAEWDDKEISLQIIDDGPGFKEEILQKIGEPFVTNRSTTKRGGGLGLGLFIAKTLLERSGAKSTFANSYAPARPGARVEITWERASLEARSLSIAQS